MATLPPVTLGHMAKLEKRTLFWAVRYIANLAKLKHTFMIKEINAFQTKMHEAGLKLVGDNSTRAAGNSNDDDPTAELSIFAEQVVHSLWDLYDNLMFRYADGYINEVKPDGTFSVTGVSYPDWWLKAVGYENGPPPVPHQPRVEWV